MEPHSKLRSGPAWLVLAAALALSAPGIHVAEASGEAEREFARFLEFTAQPASSGPQAPYGNRCTARDAESRLLATSDEVERLHRAVVATIRKELEAAGVDGAAMGLNNNGYNYRRPASELDPEALDVEIPTH